MPARHIVEKWKKDAERDARALKIAAETGVTFQQAWIQAGELEVNPQCVLLRTVNTVH